MPPSLIYLSLLAAIAFLIYKADQEDKKLRQENEQRELEAETFLNQVKNHLAETRPFEG